jgi:hypothetical protein
MATKVQHLPKFTQIGIFGLKNKPSGDPGTNGSFIECPLVPL